MPQDSSVAATTTAAPAASRADVAGAQHLRLPFRQPCNWRRMLAFLAGRATPGVERVAGDTYSRSIVIDGVQAVLEISPAAGTSFLEARTHGAASTPESVERVRRLVDADAPAETIGRTLAADRLLRGLLRFDPGVRVPGAWDGFELTVRAVLGQQVSVRAATTVAGRIAMRYGETLRPPARAVPLVRLFPGPERLKRARFNGIGIVGSRAATIRRIAAATLAGDVVFDPAQEPDVFRRSLVAIRGVGDWTAQYVAMRYLKDPDAFPASDLGLLKAVSGSTRATPAALLERAEAWRPWRAYAAMLLWTAPQASGG